MCNHWEKFNGGVVPDGYKIQLFPNSGLMIRKIDMKEMIFVAQPYYHPDKEMIEDRVRVGALYCAALLKQGKMCISPVAYGTTILNHVDLPSDFSFWDKISLSLLEKCDVIHVLQIGGWDISRGVMAEMEMAKKLDIPIKYISNDDWWKEINNANIETLNIF